MAQSCDFCKKETDTFKKILGVEVCDNCYETLLSIMQYKHYKDIVEEDRELLQRFLNKLSKKVIDK